MEERAFLKGEALRYGWEATKSKPVFFILLMVVVSILQYIPTYFKEHIGAGELVVSVLALVMQTIVGIGVIGVALKIYDTREAEIGDLFSYTSYFVNYLMGTLLYFLVVFLGSLLFIIPGIVLGLKFSFYGYLIVDKDLNPIEAFKESSRLTMGVKWDLFLMWGVIWLLNMAGALFMLVGLLVTAPVSLMAMTYIYRKLSEEL